VAGLERGEGLTEDGEIPKFTSGSSDQRKCHIREHFLNTLKSLGSASPIAL
jgi:hypothetical protein